MNSTFAFVLAVFLIFGAKLYSVEQDSVKQPQEHVLGNSGQAAQQGTFLQQYHDALERSRGLIMIAHAEATKALSKKCQQSGDLEALLDVREYMAALSNMTSATAYAQNTKYREVVALHNALLNDLAASHVRVATDYREKALKAKMQATQAGDIDRAIAYSKQAADIAEDQHTYEEHRLSQLQASVSPTVKDNTVSDSKAVFDNALESKSVALELPPEFSSTTVEVVYNAYKIDSRTADSHFKNHRFTITGIVDGFEGATRLPGKIFLVMRTPGRAFRILILVPSKTMIPPMGAVTVDGWDKGAEYTFDKAFCQELSGSSIIFRADDDSPKNSSGGGRSTGSSRGGWRH